MGSQLRSRLRSSPTCSPSCPAIPPRTGTPPPTGVLLPLFIHRLLAGILLMCRQAFLDLELGPLWTESLTAVLRETSPVDANLRRTSLVESLRRISPALTLTSTSALASAPVQPCPIWSTT